MTLTILIIKLLLGLGLLVISADFLLKKVIDIAKKTRFSASLITVTVVAFGTSLPELITSIMAAFKNIPDISLGNIVGSNLFNLLFVIGFSCIARPLQNTYTTVKKEWGFLLFATALLWILGQDLHLTKLDGILFLLVFVTFLYFIFKKDKNAEDKFFPKTSHSSRITIKDGFIFLLSMTLLLVGAHLALLAAVDLGKSIGMTERIIGLTIVSIGTGLPEMAASIVAVFRKRYDISIANILGSNIINTLLITGSAALCMPLVISKSIMTYDYLWLLAITVILFLFSIRLKTFYRSLGFLLLIIYGIYLFTLI